MARVLIVGCGCRGQALARDLVAAGHAVRGTTRSQDRTAAIAEAGAEPYVGDPDRIGTLMERAGRRDGRLLAAGTVPDPDLHGGRLRMLFEKLVDTPVRGVVYERALPEGEAIARDAAERWRIPVEIIDPAATPARRWTGCSGYHESPEIRSELGGSRVADYANDVLVDTQWVQDHLDDDSVRIVEVDENPALYAEAHIPGAIGFDWKKDLQDQVKRDFLGPEEFGALFGSRGISNEHTIVLYGDRNNWFAAYTYWYLKYYGHDDVKLVNGPREKWIAEDRPTTTEVPSYEPTTFTAQPGDDAIRAKRDEVLAALDQSTRLVDVRSPQEFSGELIAMPGYEQEGAQRAGHIPGAASVPWAQAVREDGTFKSADELSELYASKGVTNGEPVIAYCRIGERSAHTWFVLHELLGKPDVKNYDGSWTEWGNMVNVPIEKSAEPAALRVCGRSLPR